MISVGEFVSNGEYMNVSDITLRVQNVTNFGWRTRDNHPALPGTPPLKGGEL
jgi:hypothetical protein